jgi:phosphatidylglycerol:prolipoprotein diacylglycerol transferase
LAIAALYGTSSRHACRRAALAALGSGPVTIRERDCINSRLALLLLLPGKTLFQYPDIDPIAFSIGPLNVHGFVVAWWGLRTRAKRPGSPLAVGQVEDLVFYGALGVFVGGRVGYMLFYNLGGFIADPVSIFFVWRGGMSFHGGLIGVLVGIGFFARRVNLPYFAVSDLVAPWVPPALGFGRIGNFINGELWGFETSPDAPWAVVYDGVPRHASQLYEAFLEGLVLFLVLFFYSSRPRPTMAVSGLFLVGYGVFRCAIEFIRMPDNGVYFAWGWLTKGQALSVPMVIGGVALLFIAYRAQGKARATQA